MISALTLGPITFDGFEIPEHISVGGRQKLVVHTMPGGGRVVDAMGPEDAPIRWSGVFSGPDAASRIRSLDLLRKSGSELLLSWNAWRYNVVIENFEASVTSAWWIPYSIALCVIPQFTLETDWLLAATLPAITVAPLSGAALDQGIAAAGAALLAPDLGSAVSAAGQLAQYVTIRAAGVAS